MEYLAGQFGRRIQTGDDVAPAILIRIALSCHHHPERDAGIPANLGTLQSVVERRFAKIDQVAVQPHQNRLGLGIAEAAVEFEHVGSTVCRDHEPGVQKSGVGSTVCREASERRPDHLGHDALMQCRCDQRGGRIGAHAARIGAKVAVEPSLVILGRGKRNDLEAACHDDEADLFTLDEFLDDDASAGRAEAPVEHRPGGCDGCVMSLANHHSLAGCETVGLDHQRHRLCPNVVGIEVRRVEGRKAA